MAFELNPLTPTGSSTVLNAVGIGVNKKKGKITSVTLNFFEGPRYNGDWQAGTFVVDPPVAPSSSGFTLHIHADNVLLYKQGSPSPPLGTVSIGDVVWTPTP